MKGVRALRALTSINTAISSNPQNLLTNPAILYSSQPQHDDDPLPPNPQQFDQDALGIIGAGKPNYMVGTKVSRKVNTTTHKVLGVLTKSDTQIMELKRSLRSDVMDPKRRRDTPSEDSRISRIYNDEGIHELVKEANNFRHLNENSKKFLDSLEGIKNNSPEVSADNIYERAREIWKFHGGSLPSSCVYGIKKESSLDQKLISYADNKTAAERVNLMMEDPWFEYILEERAYWRKNSAILRGFLSIYIAYWNMDDLNRMYKVGKYRFSKNQLPTVHNQKIDRLSYVINHVNDFGNLDQVVYSKYGNDPDLAANVLEQLKKFQASMDNLKVVPGKRARINVSMVSNDSTPIRPARTYAVKCLQN